MFKWGRFACKNSRPWIERIKIQLQGGELELEWSGSFLATMLKNGFYLRQMLPAGGTSLASLVHDELVRGGEHKTYLAALKIAEELWQSE